MKKAYEESLRMIKAWNVKNEKEYNRLVQNYLILNAESLKYISQTRDFNKIIELAKEVWEDFFYACIINILINDFGKPACSTGGFPTLRRGSLSNYVLIAQDDLNTLGFRTGGLDGIFGAATQSAVINYQKSRGLSADGIVGCNTWRSLQENVVGTGPTNTTIN